MNQNTSNKTAVGLNRTGIATSPRMAPEMIEAARSLSPASDGSEEQVARVRALYVAHATRFGTMPPPASLKEAGADVVQMLKGNKPVVLLDKLGNRLAFERTGVRLYEALMSRVRGGPSWDGGPEAADIASIRADELEHFHLVKAWIVKLGSDPTVITPAAEVAAVAALGPLQVLGDPRIPLRSALDAILIAELTDNDGWALLIDLARSVGMTEMADDFQRALIAEERHLQRVRSWVRSGLLADAHMDLSDETDEEADTLQATEFGTDGR